MSKQFKIVLAEDASYDEIVDTITDVFGVGITVEEALSDGFQFEDIFKAIQLEPTVREVINDFPVFIAQFQNLTGSVAMLAVSEAYAKTKTLYGDIGKIGEFIYALLKQMAGTYAFIEATVTSGIGHLNDWKSLFDTLKAEKPS